MCHELAKRSENTDIGFIYSLFCRGSRTIHRDDFTSVVKGFFVPVSDAEIKLFCEQSEVFNGQQDINRTQFTTYFQSPMYYAIRRLKETPEADHIDPTTL